MRKLIRRFRYLLHRRQAERDLADEMSAHREMMAADGSAQSHFGSELRLREEARDAWGWNWLDQIRQDLSYGARSLFRSPGFTLTAIVVLSLGVGLNLAVFHVVNGVFYSRLLVRDSSTLLRIVRQTPERQQWGFPEEAVAFYRERANLFSYIVGERVGPAQVSIEDDAEPARAQFVTGNYFEDLAVEVDRGRVLHERDATPGAAPVVVLGYGYWERRFGSDPTVVGSSLRVNGKPIEVVGVAPDGFSGLTTRGADLWFPTAARSYLFDEEPSQETLNRPDTAIVAQLQPGASLSAAQSQLRALARQWREEHPDFLEDQELVQARPLGENERNFGPYDLLFALVLIVLLSSCANLGNMMLARGMTRDREIGTRIAVGADRWRIVRQLMTENLLLAALGALGGLMVGRAGASLLARLFGSTRDIRLITNGPVILFAAALALFSAVAFGLAPALRTARRDRGVTRSRQTLVAVQVAASCVLLILSGLFMRGANRLTAISEQQDYSSV